MAILCMAMAISESLWLSFNLVLLLLLSIINIVSAINVVVFQEIIFCYLNNFNVSFYPLFYIRILKLTFEKEHPKQFNHFLF